MRPVTNSLLLALALSTGLAVGQDLGAPAALTPQGRWDVGLSWGYAFDRELEDYDLRREYSTGSVDGVRKGADFEDDGCYLATVSYGLTDRVTLLVGLGAVDGGTWVDREPGNDWEGELGSAFAWAVGAKGRLLAFGDRGSVGLSARYLRVDDREVEGWRSVETGETAGELGWSTDDRLDLWQADLLVIAAWASDPVAPFVGVGYSTCDVSFDGRWTHQDAAYGTVAYSASFGSESTLAAVAGLDVALGERLAATVQASFASGTSASLALSYRF